MKIENVVINVLVALVAGLASHVFWPANPVAVKSSAQTQEARAAAAPEPKLARPLNTPPPQSPVSLITPEVRAKFTKAKEAAFTAHPELESEEDALKKESTALLSKKPPATDADRKTLMAKWQVHAQKLREAIAIADPSLQPIIADLNAKMKMRQQEVQATASPIANLKSNINNHVESSPAGK